MECLEVQYYKILPDGSLAKKSESPIPKLQTSMKSRMSIAIVRGKLHMSRMSQHLPFDWPISKQNWAKGFQQKNAIWEKINIYCFHRKKELSPWKCPTIDWDFVSFLCSISKILFFISGPLLCMLHGPNQRTDAIGGGVTLLSYVVTTYSWNWLRASVNVCSPHFSAKLYCLATRWHYKCAV